MNLIVGIGKRVFFLGSILVFITSCIGYKKTLYFQGEEKTIAPVSYITTYKLQPGDVLSIKLFTPDTKSSEFLDMEATSTTMNPASLYYNGYSINDSGYVDLALTGPMYIKDLTVFQVDSLITAKSTIYFSSATVDVKLASFKFVALGEFKDPGYHYVYNDKCTIFEAIGLANDATDVANKHKIQLIRTLPDNSKKIFHIDLTRYDNFTSETFYIQPNDIIYIQPQKAKVDSRNVQYITLGFAAVSTVLLVINFMGR